jgi:hypothetical protein
MICNLATIFAGAQPQEVEVEMAISNYYGRYLLSNE